MPKFLKKICVALFVLGFCLPSAWAANTAIKKSNISDADLSFVEKESGGGDEGGDLVLNDTHAGPKTHSDPKLLAQLKELLKLSHTGRILLDVLDKTKTEVVFASLKNTGQIGYFERDSNKIVINTTIYPDAGQNLRGQAQALGHELNHVRHRLIGVTPKPEEAVKIHPQDFQVIGFSDEALTYMMQVRLTKDWLENKNWPATFSKKMTPQEEANIQAWTDVQAELKKKDKASTVSDLDVSMGVSYVFFQILQEDGFYQKEIDNNLSWAQTVTGTKKGKAVPASMKKNVQPAELFEPSLQDLEQRLSQIP